MAAGRIIPHVLYGRKNFILGIGIDKYDNFTHLKSCKRDIDDFINISINNYQFFNKEDCKTLFNAAATKTAILEEISKAFLEKGSEWNIILYFAGHGDFVQSTKKGYIIPSDGHEKNRRSFISFDEIINKYISRSTVHHTLIICDSCSAGSIFRPYREVFVNSNYKIPSRWALTSGREERVHDGTLRKPSPFSEVLTYILNLNCKKSNALTVESLKAQLGDEFDKRFRDTKEQIPQSFPIEVEGHRHNGGQFVFIPNEDVAIPFEIENAQKANDKIVVFESKENVDLNNIRAIIPRNIEEKPINEPLSIGLPFKNDDDDIYLQPSKEELERRKERFNKFKKNAIIIFAFCFIISLVFHLIEENKYKRANPEEDDKIILVSGPAVVIQPIEKKDTTQAEQPSNEGNKNPPKGGVRPIRTIKVSRDNTFGNNLVFVGSFENKENAINILRRMKAIGYEKAEIVMKENLPYMVVVTGFYQYKSSAKAEVEAIKKRGFEVYYANEDSNRIYRKQEN
jgi:Caspase domain/SPOR domain